MSHLAEYPDCSADGFYECNNKQCIELGKKCDGVLDCFDGTDEMDVYGNDICGQSEAHLPIIATLRISVNSVHHNLESSCRPLRPAHQVPVCVHRSVSATECRLQHDFRVRRRQR